MKTPVLFIIFKRYDTAIKVFQRIREAKPEKLYVAADGPREGVEGELAECMKTRSILEHVDWPCQVFKLYHENNQGCGIGPYKAISWFFKNEEQGIVLEDDCLPHLDFFSFCEEMLDKYKDNHQISLITGRNSMKNFYGQGSYFLSAWHFCWGWASWRRVWEQYSYNLEGKSLFDYYKHLSFYFGKGNLKTKLWRMTIFLYCKKNQPRDIWDYQFAITTHFLNSFTIVPKVNLVHNVGFGEAATHTSEGKDTCIVQSLYPIDHPQKLVYKNYLDIIYAKSIYSRTRVYISFLRSFFRI